MTLPSVSSKGRCHRAERTPNERGGRGGWGGDCRRGGGTPPPPPPPRHGVKHVHQENGDEREQGPLLRNPLPRVPADGNGGEPDGEVPEQRHGVPAEPD